MRREFILYIHVHGDIDILSIDILLDVLSSVKNATPMFLYVYMYISLQ